MATPKQELRRHLVQHHRRLPAAAGRWTMEQLRRWHRGEHHAHDDSLSHYHSGENRGPGQRPPGWDTGADVVLRERRCS